MLIVLLQEGGKGHCHPRNPSQFMETAPMLLVVVPTISRIHNRRHSELSHRRPGGEIFLPTYSV